MEYSEEIRCPKCNSNQLTSNQKGFSAGKAIGGALLTGGVGLFAGFVGSKKVLITCLKCGKNFKAGEGKIVRVPIQTYMESGVSKQSTSKAIDELKLEVSGEVRQFFTKSYSQASIEVKKENKVLDMGNSESTLEKMKRIEEREQQKIERGKERRNIRVVLSVVVIFIALFILVHFSSDFSNPFVSNYGQVYFWIVLFVLGVAGLLLKAIWELTK